MRAKSTRAKGDILEKFIEEFCKGIANAKISRKVFVIGKSGTRREIDVLIEGQQGPFDVKIVIEAKNEKEPVGIGTVDALIGKLPDVGAHIGVLVCSKGFTADARKRAQESGIQIFQAFDTTLDNSKLLIPIRCVMPELLRYSLGIQGRNGGPFSIPIDTSTWRFQVDGKVLTAEEMLTRAWNDGKVPQIKGEHLINFNAVIISEVGHEDLVQYCEFSATVDVGERYYLCLVPASSLKNLGNGKHYFDLALNLYSTHEDMLNNGWKPFTTLEEMNVAADLENQPEEVRELLIRPRYTLGNQ
jgi:hypothetical protein